MSFKIGNVKIKNNLVLAPMAGINDIPFRILCKENGAGLVYSEMINANAIVRNNKASLNLAKTAEAERPVALQLFGSDKYIISKAAKLSDADIIDLNLGCPVLKVVKTGAGAALLKNPKNVQEILEKLVDRIPITIKMRIGPNAVKIAKIAEEAGVSAIAVHGRTADQGYSGNADLNAIKEIKNSVSIPVIGNGDVTDKDSYKKMIEICDAAMIGRAAKNNPAIFNEILSKKVPDKKELFFRYCELAEKPEFRKTLIHALNFSSHLKNSREMRRELSKCKTVKELKDCF